MSMTITHYLVTIVLPIQRNEGTAQPAHLIPDAIARVCKIAGGCSASKSRGWWVDDSSKLDVDQNVRIDAAVDSLGKVESLRLACQSWAVSFQQDCIYFQVVPCTVEFVSPE